MKKNYLYLIVATMVMFSPLKKIVAQPVASFSANVLSGCAPLVVNFTDNSSGSPANWNWDLGNGTLSALKNPSTTFINPGTYTISLTVSNAAGSNSIIKTSYITVYDKPRVDFYVNDSSECIPFVSTFTDISTTNFGSITSWEWDFDDGTRSNEQNPSHPFTQTGTYNVSLKATNNAGCFNILNKLAYIKASDPLKASFSFSEPVMCKAPETISFTNTTQGPGTINYLWDFGEGSNSTETNPLHIYNTPGTFTITLIANNNIGCRDTVVLNDTLTIKNNQTIIESADTVCIEKTVTLTNTSVPQPIASRWVFEDGSAGFGTTITKTWPVAGSHAVTLVSSYGTCTDTVTKTITVLEPPTANFTTDDSLFCRAPALVNYTDASTGALHWNWYFGDGSTSDSINPSHTYSAEGEYNVRLTVTNAPGCTSAVTKFRHIRISPVSVDINNREGGGCIPYTFKPYPVIISAADSITSYLWDFGNGHTSSLRYPTEIYNTTGIYTVKLFVTTSSGCRDTVILDSAVRTGTPPVIDFTYSASQVCPRTEVNFISTAAPANRWQWNFGDGNSSIDENTVHQYLDSSVNSVQLIAWNNGCSDSITKNKIIKVLPGLAKFTPVFNCNNKREVIFKDSSVSAQNWLWNFGDGTTAISQNPTHVFAAYEKYTIKLTTSSGQCTNTDSITLSIVNDTADFAVTKNTACKNETFTFYATGIQKGNIVKYTWSFGDGTVDSTSTSDTIQHRYTTGGKYSISLTIEDVNGCSSTKTRTDYVTVSSTHAQFSSAKPAGCANKTVQFLDSSTGNITQWYWNFGDGQITNYTNRESIVPHVYNNTGQYFPSLVVTDSTGCVDTAMYALPTSIYQPVANFSAANFITCINDRIQFQNFSLGENLSYYWDFGDNTFSTDSIPNKQYLNNGDFTPSLIVTDMFGCSDSISKPGYIQVRTVTAAFSTNDTVGLCIPYHTDFMNTSTNATSYSWDFGDGGYSSTINPNYYYSTPGTFFARLTAKRSNTCFSSDSVRIKINAPSGTLHYRPQNGCAPLQVNFTVTTEDKVSYIWDFNDGTSYVSRDSSVNYTYSLPGNFIPRVILKDSLGCAVPLFSPDTIRLYNTSVNFKADNVTVCSGQTVQFRDSSFSGSPVLSRRWYFGDGTSSTDIDPVHLYTSTGNYSVKLVVTTQYGCKDSIVKDNYIQVNSKPQVSIGSGDTNYCGPSAISFTAYENNNNPNTAWQWDFGNGSTSSLQNPVSRFTDTGTYNIQVIASYNQGCADTAFTTITIKALPHIFAGNDTIICAGSSIQLNATGAHTYNWSSAASLSCTNCSNPVVTTQNDIYVYVTATNEGCEKTDSLLVSVKKPFTLTASNDTSICAGRSVQLNVSGADKYAWSPAVGLSSAILNNPVATPVATTSYKVIGSDDIGCFKDSAVINVKVYQQPFVNIGADFDLSSTNAVTLSPVYGGDITTYKWGNTEGLSCYDCPTPAALPNKNSTYRVEVTNEGGCKASDEINIFVKCDNSNVSMPTAFSPNNDGLNDRFSPLGSGNVIVSSFKIFNRYGQLVFVNGNFHLGDKSGGWDGKYKGEDVATGNYLYVVEFVCGNNEVSVVKGNVMLVR